MSKECPKLVVMHNVSIVKKSNSWTMDENKSAKFDLKCQFSYRTIYHKKL